MNKLMYFPLLLSYLFFVNSYNEERFDVIIVGAGAAGIAAATKLLENNISDIRVLEAEDRIGGRILSVYFGSANVDLGAEWCQEDDDDIVYQLAKSYGVLKPSSFKRQLIHSDGTCIDMRISNDLMDFYSSMKEWNRSTEEGSESVGNLFLKQYNSTILKKYESDPEKLKIYLEAIRMFENLIDGRQGSFSWYELASSTDYEQSKAPGLDWNGSGFRTILEIMMKKLNGVMSSIDQKILLNKAVTKVKWKDRSENIIVECADGSRMEAKYVVFTPSVGVMKSKHNQIFEPGLPKEKVEAVEKIGFGSLVKVVLHFPEKWWNSNFEGTTFLWGMEDLKKLVDEFPYGPNEDNETWLSGSYSITAAENNSNVLIMWYSGKFVPAIEKTPDDIILNGTMFIVKKFFGTSYTISWPDRMIRSTWYRSPHFLGAYTFESVDSRALGFNAHDKLAEPLSSDGERPTLLFAGEGTSRKHYGLVRGAIESGYREAIRIVNLISRNK